MHTVHRFEIPRVFRKMFLLQPEMFLLPSANAKNPVFTFLLSNPADMRTALKVYTVGAFDPRVLVSILKSSNLGRIACLRFSLGRTFCTVVSWRKKSTEITGLERSERALKQGNPPFIESYGAPLLLCSSKGLVRDALRKAPAQKTPSAPKSTIAGVYP